MDSFSKIALNESLASAIVARLFGSSTRLGSFMELKDGYFNAAALLELNDGARMVLKAAPPDDVRVMRYEQNIMRAEVEAMSRVRMETSVPAPQVLVYDTSRSLLSSDFFVMSYLPGTPLDKLRRDLPREVQSEIDREMGRLTRELSRLTGPSFGYWAQPEPPGTSWRVCFDHMVQGVLQDGLEMGVGLDMDYAEIYQRIQVHLGALEEIQIPRLVHWDLWDGNIFIDPSSSKITGLIDFERVLWGDPLIEGIFVDQRADSSAIQGFGEALLDSPSGRMRRLLYNVYLHLIMVIECSFRHYPTQDQENWVRPVLAQELAQLDTVG